MMRALAAILMLSGAPALAQSPGLVPLVAERCLDAGRGADCALVPTMACRAAPGGSSTLGGEICLGAELDFWQARMERALAAAIAGELGRDAQALVDGDGRPSGAVALRAAQGLWQDWRAAHCGMARLDFWGGSGADIAALQCQVSLTAAQALQLQARAGGGA